MWRQIWRELLIEKPNLEQPVKVRNKDHADRQRDLLALLSGVAVGAILLALGWQLLR